MTFVTIGIKALNEEAHIASAITSSLAAINELGAKCRGEVVLADSGSTDRTLEIARSFPGVRIVQLADLRQRCCGAGAQLAFQAASGTYFYLLDGDMVLERGFLAQGIAFLEAHPGYAGVAGRVQEGNTTGIEFELRQANAERKRAHDNSDHFHDTDRLDCGGLYRVAAINSLGYFADRNLHSYEEFELGARLIANGWRLVRNDVLAVTHYGHTIGGLRLMWRRLHTGYAGGIGEVVRGALGERHFATVMRHFSHIRYAAIVVAWWLALAACLAFGKLAVLGLLIAAPVIILSLRRGGLRRGLYSTASWNLLAIGLLTGVIRRRTDPRVPLAMIDITGHPQ
ncbi:MAG: glycosyltransferase [Pseudomonadota bacterium]|nr:glycosyltransferase [Pseudomonadota bacterium]